jgi:hypothetical protein
MAVNINWNALQTPDFAGNAFQAQQAGQQMADRRQNALIQRNALERDQAARSAVAGPLATGDYAGAAKAAAPFDPKAAQAYLQLDETQRAAAKERATTLAGAAMSLKSVPYEQRKAQLAQMAAGLQQMGITPEQIQGFDPTDANIQAVVGQSMTAKDQFDRLDKDRTFQAGREDASQRQADRLADNARADRAQKERERADAARERRLLAAVSAAGGGGKAPSGYRYTPEGDLEAIPGGPRDPRSGGKAPQAEMQLRKEFDQQAEVKNYRTVSTAARQLDALVKGPPSAQKDIAIVYAYMRANDPNSVVREGEFATAQNAASLPDTMRNQINKVLKGERLNPKQRQEMVKTIRSIASASGERFATIADNYRGYAQQAGANPDHIVKYERRKTGGSPAQPSAQRLSPEQASKLPAGTRFIGADGVERVKH